MTVPPGSSYQAEILRYLHDHHHGHLVDGDIGAVARIFKDVGQKAGKHRPSVSASLSQLERRGCVVTDFGRPGSAISGRGTRRLEVIVLEEPPEGTTEYKERPTAGRADSGVAVEGLGPMPTAEEVAQELLRLALEASAVPMSDIRAMQRHILCLEEELDDWQALAEELDARPVVVESTVELEEARERISDLQETVAEQRAALDAVRAEAAQAVAEKEAEIDALVTRLTEAQVQVGARDTKIRSLEGDIRKHEGRMTRVRQERDQAIAERNEARSKAEIEEAKATMMAGMLNDGLNIGDPGTVIPLLTTGLEVQLRDVIRGVQERRAALRGG